jgi:UDP-N-acetylmuramoyl-tripeptide--D-alanyl-D-alanine ligase
MRLSLNEIRLILGNEAHEFDVMPVDVCIDSRNVRSGSVFIALKGERVDGHRYVSQVLEMGAIAVVANSEHLPDSLRVDPRIIDTCDTKQALHKIAAATRDGWQGILIAITGSNGKTTTKDLIYSMISQERNCGASSGNLNSTIGAPLALINGLDDSGIYIMEAGASDFAEIEKICEICKPTHACITNINLAHTEFFGDLNGVARAKWELWSWIKSCNGIAIVNMDDELVSEGAKGILRRSSYSLQKSKTGADMTIETLGMDNMARAELNLSGKQLVLSVPGQAFLECAMHAIAVCAHLGIGVNAIASVLTSFDPGNARMKLIMYHGASIIDDSYNANPASMKAALRTMLSMSCNGRRIAVLGGMNELGRDSLKLHQDLLSDIDTNNFDKVVLVGKNDSIDSLEKGFCDSGCSNLSRVQNAADAKSILDDLKDGDILLIKGSRSYNLSTIVEDIS